MKTKLGLLGGILLIFHISAFCQNNTNDSNSQTTNIEIEQLDSILAYQNNAELSAKLEVVQRSDFDKIVLLNGNEIIVKIIRIKNATVQFKYPLNSVLKEISRKDIKHIEYSYGKIELLNDKPIQDEHEDVFSWEDVQFVEEEDSIKGYQAGESVEVLFEAKKINEETEYLVKNAKIILAKKALNCGGQIVFINEKYIHQAYGELPYVKITGTVFAKE